MKNIRKFETTAEMESAVLTESYVLYNEETEIIYTSPNAGSSDNEVDYSKEYLTFVALEDGIFSFTKKGTGDDIQYSLDNGGTWVTLASGVRTPTITAGSEILWKSTIVPKINIGIGTFSSSGSFDTQGNVMSLLFGNDYNDKTDLSGEIHAFYRLFDKSKVVNASNLKLPATTLDNSCYREMFIGCTSLTIAPELPATTLDGHCYEYMFRGCTSLTKAPVLPATTLADWCYGSMFSGCTSLTTAPELPATTLPDNCYSGMFKGCTNLITAPELPATTLAHGCYDGMFLACTSLNHITMLATSIGYNSLTNWVDGVPSTGTFVKHPDMTSLPTGYDGIPNGWTVEDADI